MSDHEHHASHVEEADPDATMTFTVIVVGTILLAVIVVFIQGLYERANRAEFERKVVRETPAELHGLRVQQLTRLNAMAWVDKKNGIVAVPIDKAIDLLLADPDPAAPVALPAPSAPGTP